MWELANWNTKPPYLRLTIYDWRIEIQIYGFEMTEGEGINIYDFWFTIDEYAEIPNCIHGIIQIVE